MHIPQTEVILRHDGAELARVTLPPGEYIIGRNPDADIRADTPLLSRQHARLIIAADHVLIEDIRSSNGTFVGDQPIAGPTRLVPGQAVRLGNVTVEIRSVPAPLATAHRLLPVEVLTSRRYDLGNVIAQGGMGAILDAQQAAMKRQVAMKIMLAEDPAPDAVARFIEEAQVTGQLEHPNIVPVHELGVDDRGQPFYTMKMVRGITLGKVLKLLAEGVPATVAKYPLPVLLTIFQKVCDALAFAHSRGVIHRDLKPDNIMLDDFGVVLVMDWGLAKVIGGTRSPASPAGGEMRSIVARARAAEPEFGGTLEGTIMGTPQYMAPEQARGEIETLDARADVYALGGILYTILSLRPPVTGRRIAEVLDKVQRGEVEPLVAAVYDRRTSRSAAVKKPATSAREVGDGHRPPLQHLPGGRIPDSLAAVVAKAMAFDREHRYPSVAALQHDIEAYQNGFATGAEKAGLGKHFLLAVKRNKAASIGVAAVLLIGGVLGTKAVLEGRRAERALTDLKKSAPALLQLAESEADFQHFASALGKLDAALALDPALLRARWQRAWVLLALERWSEAADTLHLARQHDPVGAPLASILPVVERIAANGNLAGVSKADATLLLQHLQTVGASGAIIALTQKLGMSGEEKKKLVRERVTAWLGSTNGATIEVKAGSFLRVHFLNSSFTTIAPLKGLPIEDLDISGAKVDALEPIRGMPLTHLDITKTGVSDLSPLSGMPLTYLNVDSCPISDFSPLRGAPLRSLKASRSRLRDLSFLADTPIEILKLNETQVEDLSILKGKPLRSLTLNSTRVRDLTPLIGAPLRELGIPYIPPRFDLSILLKFSQLESLGISDECINLESLRHHPSLKFIQRYGKSGAIGDARPVAEFWAEYDAKQAAGKK